jgi:DnaK suppressor protein
MSASDNAHRRAAFEAMLLDRRQQLIRQVSHLEGDLDWLQGNVEPERLESAQQQAMLDMLERLDAHDRSELSAIERALERMRLGQYPLCEACHTRIPLGRQRALPAAVLCLPCAESREGLERV